MTSDGPSSSADTALDAPAHRVRLRRGAFLDAVPPDVQALHMERMRAALPHMGPDSHFCLSSAALLHGLPLFFADMDRVQVVRTRGGHGQVAPLMHGYRAPLTPPSTTVVEGLPVTSLARTAGDLMRRNLFGPALATADAALRLGASRADLLGEVKEGRGCRHATEAAMRADALSESPYESLVRAKILQGGIPLPELQVNLFDDRGFIGRVDCYWRHFGVVGEFDGEVKYTSLLADGETAADVLARQTARQRRIQALGLRVVRWVAQDVHDPVAVEHSIRAALGDVSVDHGMRPEAHDHRRPRRRRA